MPGPERQAADPRTGPGRGGLRSGSKRSVTSEAFDPQPERLSARVWRLPHAMAAGNYALVALPGKGAMAIDTGTAPGDTARAEALARALGRDLAAILYTHHHYDHVLGGRSGAVETVLAHRRFPDAFEGAREGIAAQARVAPRGSDGLDGLVHAPDRLLDPLPRLTLPEYGIEVIASPGHCSDHVSVFIPDDGVLIAADAVVTAIPPAFPSLSSCDIDWLATLDRLAGIGGATLLPGHGPVLRGADAVAGWIGTLRAYLGGLHAGIAASLDSGVPAEALPPRFPAEDHLPPEILSAPHYPVARHGRTLARMIEMAVARRCVPVGGAP